MDLAALSDNPWSCKCHSHPHQDYLSAAVIDNYRVPPHSLAAAATTPPPSPHLYPRLMDLAALSDTPWSKELEGSVKKEFDSAEALLKKSLDVKADYFDALSYMAGM